MSEALNYLSRVRPQAMGHYFSFLKSAGGALDPRTRALISVITKVANQTDRGFRQYVKRALREGVTADEILDGLLMAFPALGLAKIVWAVDILLEMDLPEFRPQALRGTGEGSWHPLGALAAIPDGASRVECDGRALFLHRDGEAVRAYDTRCPHQGTDIPAAAIEGGRLTCPRHGWVFDLATGECVARGERPLNALETRIEAGEVHAWW